MSSLILEETKILEVIKHNNADTLDVVTIKGWNVIVKTGRFKVGDKVIYIPPDSVMSTEMEQKLFPEGSKIKLDKGRVRSIKIRGVLSQGFALDPSEGLDLDYVKANVTKYEPPEKEKPAQLQGHQLKKKLLNDNFRKYIDTENIKHYMDVFTPDDIVYISEKMEGTSFRCAKLEPTNLTFWKRIKRFLGLMGQYEFCYGSRNCQLSEGKHDLHKGYTNEKQGVSFPDVYTYTVNKYLLKQIVPEGMGFYGEIVGNIQNDYHYNLPKGTWELYLYDIYDFKNGKWLDFVEFMNEYEKAKQLFDRIKTDESVVLKKVPTLYVGEFKKELIDDFRNGKSTIQLDKEREGCVIKTVVEENRHGIGRVQLKAISDVYWMNKTSDWQ